MEDDNYTIDAYKFYREEINREDFVSNNRFKSFLSLQGIFVASLGIVLSNGIASNVETISEIVPLRRALFISVTIMGAASSVLAYLGIYASNSSIKKTIRAREELIADKKIKSFPWMPSAHGDKRDHARGTVYPLITIIFFLFTWIVLFAAFRSIVGLDIRRGFDEKQSVLKTQETVKLPAITPLVSKCVFVLKNPCQRISFNWIPFKTNNLP